MACKGVLGTGAFCGSRPKKNDTYCGTHTISKFASEDDRKDKFKAHLIKRYKFVVNVADIRNILTRVPTYEIEDIRLMKCFNLSNVVRIFFENRCM